MNPEPVPPKDNLINVRVWPGNGDTYTFPEREAPPGGEFTPVTGKTGVCFSGGGTRALSATAGQLRALVGSGLIDDVAYISCVSGGSWAATAFTYYTSGAENDAQFLGPVIAPGDISRGNLDQLDPYSLGHTATSDFKSPLFEDIFSKRVPDDRAWIRAVGLTFFKPFGIFDDKNPALFSLNDRTVEEIRKRNPSLKEAKFHVVRNGRPYLVINSCIVWPTRHPHAENLVGFEYTPLYIGSAHHVTLEDKKKSREVGGGYIEPFAMGSKAPEKSGPVGESVEVFEPGRAFALADASGASSSAFAAALDRFDPDLSPHQYTWSIKDRIPGETLFDAFGDGGNLENYGLISLLRRKLDRIVVFINTPDKLSTSYDPGSDPRPNPPSSGEIDGNLPQLFGVPILNKKGKETNPYPNNTVFAASEFGVLVKALRSAKSAGQPLVKAMSMTTVKNDWWGIPAGHKVRICWVYLDRVADWESQLASDIREDIQRGNEGKPEGPFRDFPNYKTIGENTLSLVQLTKSQVNLLGHLTCWVTANSSEVTSVLKRP